VLVGLLALLTASLVAMPAAHAGLTGSPQEVAGGLSTPWEVIVTPDGRTLVTERPGRVREIEAGGVLRTVYDDDANVDKFLGMALHPNYVVNRLVYLYVSYGPGANPNANRVIRLRDDGTSLIPEATIFQGGIRSDGNHDGGRIAFGPDGKLYVTTGDVHDPTLPQSLDSLNGKILRLEAPGGLGDGAAPADNPFNSPGATGARPFIWSYGHRHPQGLAWDACGRMWESEHGPSGESYAGQNGPAGSHDEINRMTAAPTTAGRRSSATRRVRACATPSSTRATRHRPGLRAAWRSAPTGGSTPRCSPGSACCTSRSRATLWSTSRTSSPSWVASAWPPRPTAFST